jgi:hypothetical protein
MHTLLSYEYLWNTILFYLTKGYIVSCHTWSQHMQGVNVALPMKLSHDPVHWEWQSHQSSCWKADVTDWITVPMTSPLRVAPQPVLFPSPFSFPPVAILLRGFSGVRTAASRPWVQNRIAESPCRTLGMMGKNGESDDWRTSGRRKNKELCELAGRQQHDSWAAVARWWAGLMDWMVLH